LFDKIDYNQLLQELKSGNSAAREQLFEQLNVRLRSILKYRLRGWPIEELDDILQDTMLVLADKLDQVESNPDLFALTVLRNKIGNYISLHRRRVEISVDPTDCNSEKGESETVILSEKQSGNDDQLNRLVSSEIATTIRQAIRKLTPLCQALFAALFENLSVAETWELLHSVEKNLQRSAFDKRLFDCRSKLRKLLAGAV
jgi:RNA polymerase sigma factor (sigma-70 family)